MPERKGTNPIPETGSTLGKDGTRDHALPSGSGGMRPSSRGIKNQGSVSKVQVDRRGRGPGTYEDTPHHSGHTIPIGPASVHIHATLIELPIHEEGYPASATGSTRVGEETNPRFASIHAGRIAAPCLQGAFVGNALGDQPDGSTRTGAPGIIGSLVGVHDHRAAIHGNDDARLDGQSAS